LPVKTYRATRELLGQIEQVLGAKPRLAQRGRVSRAKAGAEERPQPGRAGPLDRVLALLVKSRGYLHAAAYLNSGARLIRLAGAGAASECVGMDVGRGVVGKVAETGRERLVADVAGEPDYLKIFDETRSELVVPAKIGNHVLAVIDVESARPSAFAYQDRVLLRRTAAAIARFLADEGCYLMLEARETAADHLKPRFQSHPRTLSHAAGEKTGS
jgi:putative methionine-R-sulfoxide reductase with GAF domain